MRSSRKKRPGAWIGIVLASSFLLVGAMKMSAYAEPAESTETAEITESSTGAGLSDMDFGMGNLSRSEPSKAGPMTGVKS